MIRTARLPVALLLLLATSLPALAQTGPATSTTGADAPPVGEVPPAPPPAPPSKRLMPLGLDLRLTLDTDVLLVYVDGGVGADFGLIPVGPGTLSVGGELDVGFCATACLLLNAATGLRWGHRYYSPFVRLGYHFALPKSTGLEKVDLYGMVMGGLVLASMGVSSADGSVSITGEDTSLGLGIGAGANYFIGERIFVGLEGRLRYAQGVYRVTAQVGPYQLTDSDRTWDLNGINILVFLGLRL